MICCKDFGRALEIYSTRDKALKLKLPRRIERDTIRFFDCLQIQSVETDSSTIYICTLREAELMVDRVEPEQAKTKFWQRKLTQVKMVKSKILQKKLLGFTKSPVGKDEPGGEKLTSPLDLSEDRDE